MQFRLYLSSTLVYISYLNNGLARLNLDINQLRCFIVVGEELHFGRAAQRMEMMPASLSRFIKLLEDDLGVRLLNRSTRNVALTKEGAEFFDEAVKLVNQFDLLARRFKSGKKSAVKHYESGPWTVQREVLFRSY